MGYLRNLSREPRSLAFWRDLLAEFVGTFVLMSVQAALPLSWGKPGLGGVVQVAVGMGFVLCCLVWTLGDFGGAHFNPAVTVSMAATLKITFFRAIMYIIMQCVGAICGAGFIYAVTPEKNREGLSATTLHEVAPWQGFLIETWLTFILVFTIYGATNARRKADLFMPNIPIGFALTLGIMSGFGSTGGSLNPARTLGPAVMMGIWENHWVYWAGPIVGGLLAGVLYVLLLDRVARPEKKCTKGDEEEGRV